MAILNFPLNPNHNDTYSANGIDYSYDSTSTSWTVQPNLGYTGSQGFTGSKGAGFTGSRGSLGYTGSNGFTGSIGFTGSVGYTGSSNVQGIRYGYDTGTTVAGALSGEIRFNNAALGSATQIGINATDADGNDLTSYFSTLDNYGSNILKGTLLFKPADLTSGEFAAFNVTTVFTNNSGVLTATIASAGGGLTLSDGDEVIVTLIPAVQGEQGYTGSQGVIGYTGSQGVIGYTGSQGPIGYTGSQGVIGYTGSQGVRGYTGSQGVIGYTGSQGVIGYTGSQGVIGYTGSRGATGFTGSRGVIGYTGSRGADGTSLNIQGTVATVGNLPSSGNTTGDGYVVQADANLYIWDGSSWTNVGQFVGYTGSQGIGYTGSRGATGFTGSRGARGYTGS